MSIKLSQERCTKALFSVNSRNIIISFMSPMKLHKHHRGLALGFIALSAFYYFGIMSNQSSAVMLNCSTAVSINVPVQECWGLVELFNNTNGASWTNSTNWNTDTNICTWYGVGCTNIAGQDRVTRVNLVSNNLA